MAAPKGNAYAKGNKGGGRPSEFKEEYVKIAHRMCLLGATDAELADAFDVCETTINAWKLAHIEFSEALKSGKAMADAMVAESLFKRATGYQHPAVKIFNDQGAPMVVDYIERYPPDTTAAIFWLKNRQRATWRDKQDVEQTVTAKVTQEITVEAKVELDFSDLIPAGETTE